MEVTITLNLSDEFYVRLAGAIARRLGKEGQSAPEEVIPPAPPATPQAPPVAMTIDPAEAYEAMKEESPALRRLDETCGFKAKGAEPPSLDDVKAACRQVRVRLIGPDWEDLPHTPENDARDGAIKKTLRTLALSCGAPSPLKIQPDSRGDFIAKCEGIHYDDNNNIIPF